MPKKIRQISRNLLTAKTSWMLKIEAQDYCGFGTLLNKIAIQYS